MGTEIGQLGGYGFHGVTLGVDGSCKDGRMGSSWGLDATNLGRKARANACESVERMKARVQTNRNWEGWY